MTELGLFAVLFVALFIGWLLGRRRNHDVAPKELKKVPNDYFRGLNHLLNGQQSEAIDAFVDSLEVNSDTFDIHLTLGNLFRKKGEIQKAINIHAIKRICNETLGVFIGLYSNYKNLSVHCGEKNYF